MAAQVCAQPSRRVVVAEYNIGQAVALLLALCVISRIAGICSCVHVVANGKLACSTTMVFGIRRVDRLDNVLLLQVMRLRSIASLPSLGTGHFAQPASHVG